MQVLSAISLGGIGKSAFFAAVMFMAFAALRARAADTNQAAAAWAAIGKGALVVDVRSESEFKGGALAGAVNVPHDQVGARLAEFGADKERPIVVYCRSGRRSGLAKAELEKNGFKTVINGGGLGELQAAKPAP